MENKKISIDKEKKRFELKLDDHLATLHYEVYEPSVWRLTKTLVPNQLRGKGVGSELIQQVLEYCEKNLIRIIPECNFVVHYLEKHPEWEKLLFEQE